MSRPLLAALVGILLAVTAYYGTLLYLGARPLDAFRPRSRPTDWPVPENAANHPFWVHFPDIQGKSPDRRTAAIETLLALDRDQLPHPAKRPSAWDMDFRAHVRALLWRLYRGRPFRVDGLELHLAYANAEPIRAGRPVTLTLAVEPVGGLTRPRLTLDLDRMVQTGARVYLVTRPPGRALPRSATPGTSATSGKTSPTPARPARIRERTPLHYSPFQSIVFRTPGPCTVIAALDLRAVPGKDGPRGLLVSGPLTVQVMADVVANRPPEKP